MKKLPRKRTWRIIPLMAVAVVTVLMMLSIGLAQVTQVEVKKTVVQYYEIGGHLTAINLKEKKAMLDGHKWDLSEDFNKKGLPSEWIKQGSYQCKNGYIVVRYYVSVKIQAEAPLNIGEKTKEGIREIINAEDVQELFNRGGKVYRIEILPA